jgi:plasmid stability protein
MKVTVAFRDEELYRAIKVRAAASGRQVRDVIEEALEAWLDAVETAEDIAISKEQIALYERGEFVDAHEFFAKMVAEGRLDYQTDAEE